MVLAYCECYLWQPEDSYSFGNTLAKPGILGNLERLTPRVLTSVHNILHNFRFKGSTQNVSAPEEENL